MSNINVSTWNVHGKGNPEEIDKIIYKSFESKGDKPTPHIVCVQQANLPPSSDLGNYRWLCSGMFGSAVLINKAFTSNENTFTQVCEEICVAEVMMNHGVYIQVISCYMPPSTEYVTKDLWLKLVEVLKSVPGNMSYVLAGDFNAEIGKDDVSQLGVHKGRIGELLHHKSSNENGIQLMKLSFNFHATIASTFGGKTDAPHTYNDGNVKSQRSFIIVPSDRLLYPTRAMLQDCKSSWNPGYNTALLSKSFRFTHYEKMSNLVDSPVIVSSWNIQGASPSAVDKALSDLDLPIVCVQDLFLTSADDVQTSNYTWYSSKKLWGKNVGILIKNGSGISMTDFKVVSENVCVGNITSKGFTIKVICCSIPSHSDSARFQEVTTKLMDLVKSIPEDTLFFVNGDFNTHATYTILDDALVFDEADENGLFLERIMRKCNMEMPYLPKSSVTQVSEKVRRQSSFILMSPSCLWKFSHRRITRWVPYFENCVVSLYLPDSDIENNEPFYSKEWKDGKVEHIDGFTYKTKKFCRIKRNLSIGTTEQQAYRYLPSDVVEKQHLNKSDLPSEITTKYKNSPPPFDELLSILGDRFTLYNGFLQESSASKSCVNILAASFESMRQEIYPWLAECIDVLEEKTKNPVKRIIKFRWNGIVVHEHEGGKFTSFRRIINKGQSELISKLGQHYFTVKARSSYYNNGLPPQCQDKNQLNKIMRIVKREDFPPSDTKEYVKVEINELFNKNQDHELVFGPDFPGISETIKKFSGNKRQGIRLFKSREDLDHHDHIAVFVNRTPQEIRNMLLKAPGHQDLRFQLFPPCGTDNDYFDWIAQWTEKTIPEEYFKPYESKVVPETSKIHCNGSTGETIKLESALEEVRTVRHIGVVNDKVRNIGNPKNRVQHVVKKCYTGVRRMKVNKNALQRAREESDLPREYVNKYRETPPDAKTLRRILGDSFTLYYGFGSDSHAFGGTSSVLRESFEAIGHGNIAMENIEVWREGQRCSKLVKFKWNGICIHQEGGTLEETFTGIAQKGQVTLIDRLGQHFYAVRAKMTFFNGKLPQSPDKEKLNEAVKIVEKSEITSSDNPEKQIEEVQKFIGEFFSKDTDVELIFGPEFKLCEVAEIKTFAAEKKINYRFMKSKEDLDKNDCMSFFIKQNPIKIRDKLMKIPDHQDMRFFLVPPCEFYNKSHIEWIKSWAAENFNEEFKLILEKEKNFKPPLSAQKPKPEQKKQTPVTQRKQPQNRRKIVMRRGDDRGHRETTQTHSLPYRSDNYGHSSSLGVRGEGSYAAFRSSERRQVDDYDHYRDFQRSQTSVLASRSSERRQVDDYDYYRDFERPQTSVSASRSSERRQVDDYDRYRDFERPQTSVSASRSSERRKVDDYDRYRDFEQPQTSVSGRSIQDTLNNITAKFAADRNSILLQMMDNYDHYRDNPQPQSSASAGRKREWTQMDDYDPYVDYSHSEPTISGAYADDRLTNDRAGRQDYNQAPERYVPEKKRARNRKGSTSQAGPRAEKPRWDDLAPLVIVWPINVRSEHEKDPRRVLEANFPTEVSLESNNKVAVYVTLPHRNRSDKKYCLSVGDGVYKATKTALDMIVKRSSVIKYAINYLPLDGQIPNFIRYNIPCQTNPRTYITLRYTDTGPLSQEKITELFDSFKYSLNEDLFFDKDYYTHDMKLLLLDLAPKYGLKVRHFGEGQKLVDRYVCVYKTRPKEEVLEEVLKMRDLHPKYRLATNKLPPRLGLNIF